jgi:hypothetical protein
VESNDEYVKKLELLLLEARSGQQEANAQLLAV